MSALARQAILIYLQGGLSRYENFALGPHASAEFRGDSDSVATSLPGVSFCEHTPRLAARAHLFNVIRSTYVDPLSHPEAIYKSLTGWTAPDSILQVTRNTVHHILPLDQS